MQNNDKHKDAYFVYISVCEKTIIMKHILYFILFVFLLNSCSRVSNVEKRQDHSTNIVDVKELVKEIVIAPPLIGGWARPFIVNNDLLINIEH